MGALASIELEFLGRTWWWVGVVGVAGLVMLVYAWMVRLEEMRVARAAGMLGGAAILMGGAVAWIGVEWLALLWMVIVVVGAVSIFYRRVYGALGRRRMGILLALRVAGMGTLALLLFQPVLGFVRSPTERARVAVVVDASGSMGYADAPNQPNRYRQAAIAVQDVLVPRLGDAFEVQVFAYDGKHAEKLSGAEELDRITPAGEVTDLGAAVGLGMSDGSDKVIVISDGIHNGPRSVAAEMADGTMKAVVHGVRVGSSEVEPSTVPDIAVVSVDGPQTAVVNNQVTLGAAVKSTAMSDRTVRVLLKDATGKQMDEQRLVLRSGATPQTVQLKFTPEKVGRMSVRVEVPVDPGERSEANNVQELAILVTDPKLGVLYVEGRVRPEVGPLKRALEQDPNVQLVSMVQTVAGRFSLSGIKDGDDLKGLPTNLAQWKRFKVVIIGDLDASFLSTEQQKDLEQVVKEGTGLLMIGGQNSFAPGGWGKTALATVLPVDLRSVEPAQINTKFVPELTATGAMHPIFRGIAGFFMGADGTIGNAAMPQLSGCVALAEAKAGAEVLAVHPTEKIGGANAIVLAVQQYGKGRSAAFAADTTWHWNLFMRGLGKDSPYNRFWGQMVRWLASEDELQKKNGPSVVAMMTKERYEAGEHVTLRAAVTDKEGQSTNYANAWAEVTGPGGKMERVTMKARAEEGQIGMYEAEYLPGMSGKYKVAMRASKDGGDLGKDATEFVVLAAASEKDVLAARPEVLQELARGTGGSFVELSGIGALADRLAAELPREAMSVKTTWPLFHARGFFFLVVGVLGLEWYLRRRWQLQ